MGDPDGRAIEHMRGFCVRGLAETPGAIEAESAGAARRFWPSACRDQTRDEVKT